MARLTAPFLSFSASGQLAKTMVAAQWKGIPYIRKYVVPANPNTAAQQTQRTALGNVVSAWRNYITDSDERSAWTRSASVLSTVMSGFNAFTASCVKIIVSTADASYADGCAAAAGMFAEFTMKNIDDGTTGDEAGNFEVWAGSSPSSLLLIEDDATIAMGVITSSALGTAGDVCYVKIRKDSQDRSGIHKITLLAA